ncbi:uncharacterized protein LOC125076269 isoform X2 [Vanessa atalanta]|nr:uncharacterized protein LOC125076269 isoform X2 [Vanessa atalanta]XP_047544326.1 uncharacterized protein LOC125076269 isoform X2 [Vanessa atalanta]XP_047544327.1 uncharacterized protein LOC125076269 isoform X2 [Vanessa atalanta]
MINNDDHKKEKPVGAGFYSSHSPPPDTNVICESLVSKLTDKSDEPSPSQPKPLIPIRPIKDHSLSVSDQLSDSDNLEIADDESDWSSGPPSPAPLKAPRAFEKSDNLYEKQTAAEKEQEAEELSWDAENFQQEGLPIPKTENTYQP